VIHCTVLFFNNKQLAFKKEPDQQVTVHTHNSSHLLTRGESNREPGREAKLIKRLAIPCKQSEGHRATVQAAARAKRGSDLKVQATTQAAFSRWQTSQQPKGPCSSNRGSRHSSRLGRMIKHEGSTNR